MLPARKIIKASAGTGKTYRLSLEFLRLLIRGEGAVSFDEILVITFTRKATAEIRSRIIEHLDELIRQSEAGIKIRENLQNIDPDLKFDSGTFRLLEEIRRSMLIDKSRIRISTIDAFINRIFNNLIAPHHNLTGYKISPDINREYLPELFDALLQTQHLDILNMVMGFSRNRNLKNYERLILDLLQQRWLLETGRNSGFSALKDTRELADTARLQYLEIMRKVLTNLQDHLSTRFDPDTIVPEWPKLLKKDFYELMRDEILLDRLPTGEFAAGIGKIIAREGFLRQNFNKLLGMSNFWNGNKLLNRNADEDLKNEMQHALEEAEGFLADYLLFTLVKEEHHQLLKIADLLYRKYDEIKFRQRIFTYEDIAYYTYRYLFQGEDSLLAAGNILNIIYEFLAYRIRYILIDEFQDTSVLQWSILYPIISEVISGEGIKEYGGVVLVGDEKQSIYGWRGGERDLLLLAPRLLSTEDAGEVLGTCYRNTPQLSGFINALFGDARWQNHLAGMDIEWPFTPVTAASKETQGAIGFRLINLQEEEQTREEFYENFIQHQLKPLLDSGRIDPAASVILARKNRDLELLGSYLSAAGIPYVLESASSIFQHRAVKPILHLLTFLAAGDLLELLKFLRCDAVLMPAPQLKQIINLWRETGHLTSFLNQLSSSGIFRIISRLYNEREKDLLFLIKDLIESLNLHLVFNTEADARNLDHFFQICADFLRNPNELTPNLMGFLQYCLHLEGSSEFLQQGLEESSFLKLMTIHKAKGLQFETVFLLYDACPRTPSQNHGLNFLYEYDDDFSRIENLILSYNYDAVLRYGSCLPITQEETARNVIEELNNLYVAVTRAKRNLFIFGYYSLKKGFDDLLKKIGSYKTQSVPVLFSLICSQLGPEESLQDGNIISYQLGSPATEKEKTSSDVVKPSSKLPEGYLGFLDWNKIIPWEQPLSGYNLLTYYLNKQAILLGDVTHFYLMHIVYDTPEQRSGAYLKTRERFGTSLSGRKLELLINRIHDFLGRRSDLFNRTLWNRVFNEYVIFDKAGREKRIDRLLVNEDKKSILIVDYKTGETYAEDQLEAYRSIIRDLPWIKEQKYAVETEYVEIDLGELNE
ncbi:MAG: UvrD-helicase domain-containing protein [Candidatus Cloacimonetes bacterium]|nr:UvrD-helicase domain-containing protein [Candidatus Cloacimonadota bacterium]